MSSPANMSIPQVTQVDAIVAATRVLQSAGIESAILDARLLMMQACACTLTDLVMSPERVLTPDELAMFEKLLARRFEREPMSHILGTREFWGLPFEVSKNVLDPRPDSETIIEAVLAHRPQVIDPIEILDLGTGSGCLLVSLLSEYKWAQGTGVDISPDALEVAKRNAHKLVLDERAKLVQSDWCEKLVGTFDVIVSNPPYISETEFTGLSAEVTEHEPKQALLAGPDGLDCYRALIPQLPRVMKQGALVVLEIGFAQAADVSQLLESSGFRVLEVRKDLAGHDRCVVAEQNN